MESSTFHYSKSTAAQNINNGVSKKCTLRESWKAFLSWREFQHPKRDIPFLVMALLELKETISRKSKSDISQLRRCFLNVDILHRIRNLPHTEHSFFFLFYDY